MNKHYLIVLLCLAVLVVMAVSILEPRVVPESDALSYLAAMEGFDKGDGASLGTLVYRVVAAGGGITTVIGLSKLLGSYENAWMFLNVFFYAGCVMFSYELVRRLHGSRNVALLSAMFLAGNYAMLTYGLGYFMDAGGWMFYILSALGVLMYAQSGEQRYLWWAAAAVGIGGLFKEYPFLGALLIGFYLIYENWRKPLDFLKKVWKPAVISAVPVSILHGSVYFKYHFTYFDWLASNQAHYVYASRIVEFVKTYGSLLNLLGLLALAGLFYFWTSRREAAALPQSKNNLAYVVCLFLSMLPILFWPAITQRILFISVPAVIVLASYLFKRFESKLYLFLPVLALYIIISFYMDSYILGAFNLPF